MKDRKAAGTSRERQVVAAYRDEGWIAFRAPASLGVADVVAMRRLPPVVHENVRKIVWTAPIGSPWQELAYEVLAHGGYASSETELAECKANLGSPWMNFRKPERDRLSEAARVAGARALLVHWPPNKPRRDYYEEEWPN